MLDGSFRHKLVLSWMALALSKGTKIPHAIYHSKKLLYVSQVSL